MNADPGRPAGVVVGAFLLLLAGTAMAGATLLHGWVSPALVLAGAALLGSGVSLMTIPAQERWRRLGR